MGILRKKERISWRRGTNPWPLHLGMDSLTTSRSTKQPDIDRLQARLSPLLSERRCNLEGTMGKGQEKGGSIVWASCWIWLTLIVWPETSFFWYIFWEHPDFPTYSVTLLDQHSEMRLFEYLLHEIQTWREIISKHVDYVWCISRCI